jgi:signal peptidase I
MGSQSTPVRSQDERIEGSANESFLSQVFGFFKELIPVVLMSLAIIIPVRYFLIQPFYVKGASMEPNFHDDEYLIIDEISYRLREPMRGEIVVFRYPNDPRQYFIKRVVGLPGERVVVLDGRVTVFNREYPKGQVVDEGAYLGELATPGYKDVVLGNEEYFLMGDNRGVSLDSRSFGPVQKSLIVGKVWVRGWPPERAGVIETQGPTLE